MKITWLGHSSFRIEIADQVLLVDPWIDGNPVFPEGRRQEALAGATAIFVSHGHGDHASNARAIARETSAPIFACHEIATLWDGEDDLSVTGFGKGGTITLGDVQVSMVNAVHSSSIDFDGNGPSAAGSESGFMIRGEGRTIYFSGDTDIMADMAWFGEYYAPDIGILCAGGHYTMDMKAAAWCARRYFDFKTVIPCHYKTFPLLAQNANDLIAGLEGSGIEVREPEVLTAIEL